MEGLLSEAHITYKLIEQEKRKGSLQDVVSTKGYGKAFKTECVKLSKDFFWKALKEP